MGDKLLSVGSVDVTGQAVADMRHLIIGEIGSTCSITLRQGGTGQVSRARRLALTSQLSPSFDLLALDSLSGLFNERTMYVSISFPGSTLGIPTVYVLRIEG